MDPILITIVISVVAGALMFYLANQRPQKYPTGPFLFPFLGNIPQLLWRRNINHQKRHEIYKEYSERYGPIFSMKFGPYKSVILNNPQLIKEAWSNYNLCGRPKMPGSAVRTRGTTRGILFQDGDEWSEQRRFALRHLKDFGFGKRSMENMIVDEVLELIEGFKRDVGVPISTQSRFNIAVLNSLWRMISGERFSQDDEKLREIMESIERSLHYQGLIFVFPLLRKLAPDLSGWNAFVKNVTGSTEFVESFVKDKLNSYDDTKEPTDFTEVYIKEMRKTTDTGSSFYGKRGEDTLVATVLDLFVAGAETTSTTLTYMFLYMALFPEKQRKVWEEIQHVLGSRHPTLEDRARMPYTEATILETLRFSSMVPLGIMHKALVDVELGGYIIPKGTFVTPNLYGVHYSKEIWGDPDNFRPERFLSNSGEGKSVIKNDGLLAFSYGKRLCLGETLARNELFLFTASLLQNFEVGPDLDPNAPKLTTEQLSTNLVMPPVSHKLVLKLRI